MGNGRDDVHLRIDHITGAMCAGLPDVAADLVELASFVYAADQAVNRGGTKEFEYGRHWRRQFRFEVPVRRVDKWRQPEVVDVLAATLGFLSDDDYEFGFAPYRNPPPMTRYLFEQSGDSKGHDFEEVLLFSGGLDSLGGGGPGGSGRPPEGRPGEPPTGQ
jgi:hypothetical protein